MRDLELSAVIFLTVIVSVGLCYLVSNEHLQPSYAEADTMTLPLTARHDWLRAAEQKTTTRAALGVAVHMFLCADKNGKSYPGSKACGLSPRSMVRAVAELEAAELITVQRRNGAANVYWLRYQTSATAGTGAIADTGSTSAIDGIGLTPTSATGDTGSTGATAGTSAICDHQPVPSVTKTSAIRGTRTGIEQRERTEDAPAPAQRALDPMSQAMHDIDAQPGPMPQRIRERRSVADLQIECAYIACRKPDERELWEGLIYKFGYEDVKAGVVHLRQEHSTRHDAHRLRVFPDAVLTLINAYDERIAAHKSNNNQGGGQ